MAIDVETEDDEELFYRVSSRDDPVGFMFAAMGGVVFGTLAIIAEVVAVTGEQVARVSKVLGMVVWFVLSVIIASFIGYLIGYLATLVLNYAERKLQEHPAAFVATSLVVVGLAFAVTYIVAFVYGVESQERFVEKLEGLDERTSVEVSISEPAKANDD